MRHWVVGPAPASQRFVGRRASCRWLLTRARTRTLTLTLTLALTLTLTLTLTLKVSQLREQLSVEQDARGSADRESSEMRAQVSPKSALAYLLAHLLTRLFCVCYLLSYLLMRIQLDATLRACKQSSDECRRLRTLLSHHAASSPGEACIRAWILHAHAWHTPRAVHAYTCISPRGFLTW